MASYFVAYQAPARGEAAVHDRSRCPPGRFQPEAATTEYLGEFLDPSQAIAVARLRYSLVRGCPCCESQPALAAVAAPAAQPLSPS